MNGGGSSNPPQITDEDMVTSPIESSEELSSLSESSLDCSASSFEIVRRCRGSAGSSHSSFTLIEGDSGALELDSGSPPPETPVPTEEEEFLANMTGNTDEFGVRLC